MTLFFKAPALREIQEIYDWYEEQQAGLGEEFLDELDAVAEQLRYPRAFRRKYKSFRIINLHRFPYHLYFRVGKEEVVVYAVVHAQRSRKRLKL